MVISRSIPVPRWIRICYLTHSWCTSTCWRRRRSRRSRFRSVQSTRLAGIAWALRIHIAGGAHWRTSATCAAIVRTPPRIRSIGSPTRAVDVRRSPPSRRTSCNAPPPGPSSSSLKIYQLSPGSSCARSPLSTKPWSPMPRGSPTAWIAPHRGRICCRRYLRVDITSPPSCPSEWQTGPIWWRRTLPSLIATRTARVRNACHRVFRAIGALMAIDARTTQRRTVGMTFSSRESA